MILINMVGFDGNYIGFKVYVLVVFLIIKYVGCVINEFINDVYNFID